jgi:hypothetical protein
MTSSIPGPKNHPLLLAALLAALVGGACGTQPALTPLVQVETQLQTVEVTVEVTSEVTRQVTSEVTRLVEVPVTITPSPTPEISLTPTLTASRTVIPTITRTPSKTPTPSPPVVTILVRTACYFGPSNAYLYDYGLNETSWMEVIGRAPSNPNTDPKDIWLYIQGVHGWNPCWAKNEYVRFNDGRTLEQHTEIPIVAQGSLPWSNLYRGVTDVHAIRNKENNNKVDIVWSAIWMTEDDYRGYLIEAWLCHNGQLDFTPLQWFPYFQNNAGVMGIRVIDEPGCLQPSSARIAAAEKHGYTTFTVIHWPDFAVTSTPTPTPSASPTQP